MVRSARSTVPRPQIPTGVARYLLAVVVVAAATLLRVALTRVTGELPPFVIFFPTVALVALLLGAGPGIWATFLAALVADYFILTPVHTFGPASLGDTVALGLFVSGGLLISLMAGRVVSARRREAAAAERARNAEALQQADRSLRDAEAQVRLQAAALEAAPNAISISETDQQGTIVWVNRAFTELTGYSVEEALGHTHHLLSPGRQDQTFYDELWETIRRGEVWRGELVNRRKDGTIYYEEMGITPLRDEAGQITHYVAIKQNITARKEAETALRESEERFRALADAVPLMVWQCTPDRNCDYFNRRWLEFTGRSFEQEQGFGWAEGVHPDDVQRCVATFIAAAVQHQPFEMEYRLRHHSGEYRWVLDDGRPRFGSNGSFMGYVGGCVDIHDRKRAEAALAESEAKYRILFENMGEEVHFWRLVRNEAGQITTWRLVDANPAALKTWGRTLNEVQGKTTDEIFGPGATEHFMPVVQKVMTEGAAHSFEDYFAPLERTFRFTTVPLGEYFITTGADITERKRAEEALREREALLQKALSAPTVGVLFFSLDGHMRRANQTFERMSGYSSEELAGATHWQMLTAPEFWEPTERIATELAEKGVVRPYAKQMVRKDGSRWWGLFAPTRLSGSGWNSECVEFIIDITERKQAEEALVAAKRAAEQANAAKDHFLAVLSHELRTPLTPVLPALYELSKQVPETAREDVEMARRNVELEARLIDDLLDVTRIARGKIELQRETVELCTVVRRAAEVCAPDIEARQLHFGVEVEDGPYPVKADPARLQQVFWNLIKNAIKFTPHGGCVGVRCQGQGGQVLVEVKDSGMGIEPEALARIFNAFEQVDRMVTRQFGGLGLGLAISKTLVEMHGGTIQARSEGRGRGATFTVRLPILRLAEGGMLSPGAGCPAGGAQAPTSAQPVHILLVEDHGDTARVLRRMLQARGHKVEMAGDVASALELAEQRPFDLLLSDLGLPDGSGVDLMRKLREHGRTLPGIALSGYGQEDDIRRSHEAGFAEHLTKPVNLGQLEAAIGRVAAR